VKRGRIWGQFGAGGPRLAPPAALVAGLLLRRALRRAVLQVRLGRRLCGPVGTQRRARSQQNADRTSAARPPSEWSELDCFSEKSETNLRSRSESTSVPKLSTMSFLIEATSVCFN